MPAAYGKPFIERRNNDYADAKTIAQAAVRPAMRFGTVMSVATQGRAVAFRTHQYIVRRRMHLMNALRVHLAEFGLVALFGAQTEDGCGNVQR